MAYKCKGIPGMVPAKPVKAKVIGYPDPTARITSQTGGSRVYQSRTYDKNTTFPPSRGK